MKNVTLIGMPGAGKSTIGVLLAKKLGYAFHDTDITLQVQQGKTLSALIAEIGGEAVMDLESQLISSLNVERQVIATGGSAVFGRSGMKNLQQISDIVYLKVSLEELCDRVEDLQTRGVILNGCSNLEELFFQRVPLYEKYAQIIIDCDGKTAQQCVDEICGCLKEKKQ
ncbi:MAG: shikimate kinase [Clostridia bacterium]|nr:shikimate kinase [Clostridia bacterium]